MVEVGTCQKGSTFASQENVEADIFSHAGVARCCSVCAAGLAHGQSTAISVGCSTSGENDPAKLAASLFASPKGKAEVWNGEIVFLAPQMLGQDKIDCRHMEILACSTRSSCLRAKCLERS